jgi:chromosome partitioning protein
MHGMRRTFTAGRVAEIAGVSRDQIRKWAEEGHISPVRDDRNHRIYSPRDVRRILELAGKQVRRGISVVNQKGGVGKTTTVFNLSAALALEGRRVLVVDLDAQGSLTVSFGATSESFAKTSHDLLVDDDVTADQVITRTPIEGVDLVPADIRLASADVLLREMIMRERILASKLQSLRDRYDFLLYDCPPNLSTIVINALVASSDAIVPLETQYYSVKAVEDLTKTFNLLATRMGHRLRVWMLPTKIDRRVKMSREFLERMEESFRGRLLTPVRTDANIMKAPMAREPAVLAFPSSRGARDYRRIAREILETGEAPLEVPDFSAN